MSFFLLHADRSSTLIADDPIVPATAVPRFNEAIGLLKAAGQLREQAEASVAEATEAGRAAGCAEGHAAGLAAAQDETRSRLFALEMEAAEARAKQRADAAGLAIEIVRRIASTIGSEETVAALAAQAASLLAPDNPAVVRVPPAAAEAVRTRLAGREGVEVTPDPQLGDDDCVVETSHGTIRAGLEVQLAAVERAWAGGREG